MIEGGCIEKKCTLAKSASSLQCEFVGLEPATKYAVNVRTCLPSSIGCSSNLTGLAITTPGGKIHNLDATHLVEVLILMFNLSLV